MVLLSRLRPVNALHPGHGDHRLPIEQCRDEAGQVAELLVDQRPADVSPGCDAFDGHRRDPSATAISRAVSNSCSRRVTVLAVVGSVVDLLHLHGVCAHAEAATSLQKGDIFASLGRPNRRREPGGPDLPFNGMLRRITVAKAELEDNGTLPHIRDKWLGSSAADHHY